MKLLPTSWENEGRRFKVGDMVRPRFTIDMNICDFREGIIISSSSRLSKKKVVVKWNQSQKPKIHEIIDLEKIYEFTRRTKV
jgi:hypothetical protein